MSEFTRENGGFNQRTCVLCGQQRGDFRLGDKAWCRDCAIKKVRPCAWCGKTYDEHRDREDPRWRSRMPCGGVKANFLAIKMTPPKLFDEPPSPEGMLR